MFPFKGLVATSTKKFNENAGFATPLGKNVLSRKNIFSEKSKVVLSDVKNTFFSIQTPKSEKSKHNMNSIFLTTPKIENVKIKTVSNLRTPKTGRTKLSHNELFSSTPKFENVKTNALFEVTTPKLNRKLDIQRSSSNEKLKRLFVERTENLAASTPQSLKQEQKHVDDFDKWNEKLLLSEEQFKLLFLEPNMNLSPPTPPPYEVEPLHYVIPDILSPPVLRTDNGSQLNDDIPPINLSMDIDFWDDF